MRPISLTMESFGSYLNKTEIDFTKIAEPLFLITGDTGAGKSTVFDAIVFALYGKSSSSGGKEGVDFKSQYGDKKPSVVFKFEKNNKEYVVSRSVKEVKRTKNGVKTVGALTSLSLTLPDNVEFLGKVSDTEKKIEEIMGLTKEQFMQIAMIAQGEFMALLRAKSDNKKEIFRKLFHTEKFAKIIEIIKEKRKNIHAEVDRAGSLCKKDVGRVKILDNDELLNLQEEIIAKKNMDIVSLEKFLEILNEILKDGESKKSVLTDEVKTLKKERDVLKENYTKSEELKKNFDLLKNEESKLEKLSKEEANVKNYDKLSAEIEKSYDLKDKYDNFENAQKSLSELEKNLEKENKNSPLLKKELLTSENELKSADENAKKELPKLLETAEKAKNALKILDDISAIKKSIDILGKRLESEEENKEKIANDAAKLKAEIEAKKGELEKLKGIDARREKLKREEIEMEDFIANAKELKGYEDAIKSLTAKIKNLQEEYKKKKLELEKIEQEYKTKENLFFDSQAGVLAQKLEDGSPCPVCGSLSHPNPAKFTVAKISKEELDVLKEKVETARENRENASKAISENNVVLSEKEKLYAQKKDEIQAVILSKEIEISEDLTVSFLRKIYSNWNKELSEKEDTLKKDELAEKVATSFIINSEKMLSDYEKKKEDLSKIHIELAQKVSALTGQYDEMIKNKIYNSKLEANIALNDALKKQNEMELNLKNLKIKREQIKSKFEKCETLISEYKSNLPKEEKNTKRLKEIYDSLKEKYDLSEEEWGKLVDNYKKEDSGILREKAVDFYKQKSKLEGSVGALKEKVKNGVYPNLTDLQTILSEKEKILSQKETELNSFKENFSNNKDAYNSLVKEKKSREKIISLYQVYDKLANKLSSSANGGYLDIETFAQRYYLSEILSCANGRLSSMTDGEYEMRLASDKEANELRSRGGLDFMIHSYSTGKDREIRTLSGGESFLTALSLSLGMADSIERRSAAVSPDILFIDEGFGSLDNSARREAVRVLKSVAGKNRMIAIISHVSELRQEMDAKLIVKKGSDGSRVYWES